MADKNIASNNLKQAKYLLSQIEIINKQIESKKKT